MGSVNSLTGEVGATGIDLNGNFFNQNTNAGGVLTDDEVAFKNLKKYLLDNFIEPLILRKIENVNYNNFNFSYILTQLKDLGHIDPEEAEVLERIVIFVQETVGTFNQNEIMTTRLYGNNGQVAQFVNTLPFITLKAHYEVYNSLYGKPDGFVYDEKILKEIKNILDKNPGMLYRDIENTLNYRFNDTILQMKFKKNIDKDPNHVKIEYLIYDKIFDKKYHHQEYNTSLLIIIKDIIKEHPTYTISDIKRYIYVNHKYWAQFYLESIHPNVKNPKKIYDELFGKPIDKNYNYNYIKLIKIILEEYPDISITDLELEFEFRQPIWGETLLKNQSINAMLFKETRFNESNRYEIKNFKPWEKYSTSEAKAIVESQKQQGVPKSQWYTYDNSLEKQSIHAGKNQEFLTKTVFIKAPKMNF
jgi:hypothetical protein